MSSYKRIVDSRSAQAYYLACTLHRAEVFEKSTLDLTVTDGTGVWEGKGVR